MHEPLNASMTVSVNAGGLVDGFASAGPGKYSTSVRARAMRCALVLPGMESAAQMLQAAHAIQALLQSWADRHSPSSWDLGLQDAVLSASFDLVLARGDRGSAALAGLLSDARELMQGLVDGPAADAPAAGGR